MINEAPLLLDVSRLLWRRWEDLRPTGIDRICLAWLEYYAPRAQAVIVHKGGRIILPFGASQALFQRLLEPASGKAAIRGALVAWALRHGGHVFQTLPGRGRPWLNIGHTGLNLPDLGDWCRRANVRPILMVHDLIPITHPQYCRAGEAERHAVRINTALNIATAVIANSQHTLDTLADYATARGLAMPPCLVAWPGTPRLAIRPEQRTEPSDEFIILGTIEGRKNHMVLLKAWSHLLRQSGAAAPRLVIIGRRGWACDDVLERLDAGVYGDRVIETGPLDDEAIASRLSNARALLFPSFAEGYGLPLVEALDAGVPVIASDLPVFREIGQGVPDLLKPDDVAGWTSAIGDYSRPDSPARAAQLTRMAGFRAPNWRDHFKSVDVFLKQLTA